jgi:hypothetical protein
MNYLALAAAVATTGVLLAGSSHGEEAAPSRPSVAEPVLASASDAAPAGAEGLTAYNNACGAGYGVIDTLTITSPAGARRGHVYLTYNPSNGYNCVVTLRDSSGSALPMNAWIMRSDGTGLSKDVGEYQTYAGPVYVHAPGSCIDWGGFIYDQSAYRENVHCG